MYKQCSLYIVEKVEDLEYNPGEHHRQYFGNWRDYCLLVEIVLYFSGISRAKEGHFPIIIKFVQ